MHTTCPQSGVRGGVGAIGGAGGDGEKTISKSASLGCGVGGFSSTRPSTAGGGVDGDGGGGGDGSPAKTKAGHDRKTR